MLTVISLGPIVVVYDPENRLSWLESKCVHRQQDKHWIFYRAQNPAGTSYHNTIVIGDRHAVNAWKTCNPHCVVFLTTSEELEESEHYFVSCDPIQLLNNMIEHIQNK